MKRSLLNLALTLCSVGGAALAIGVADGSIGRWIYLPDWAYTAFLIAGFILTVLGVLAFLALFLVRSLEFVEPLVERTFPDGFDSEYVCAFACGNDLQSLHALHSSYFGSDVPSVDLMRSWMDRCGSAFMLIHRMTHGKYLSGSEELVGSFKLLPLTVAGVRAIELGQVTGSSLRPQHICSHRARAAAYYVGDVVATARFARGIVMAYLNVACTVAAKSGADIYARPLTRDGLRIMRKYGFRQVSDGKSVPEIGKMCRLIAASDRTGAHSPGRKIFELGSRRVARAADTSAQRK